MDELLLVAQGWPCTLPTGSLVDRLLESVRDAVAQIGDDVLESPVEHLCHQIISWKRLRRAQFCNQRRCFRADRSYS